MELYDLYEQYRTPLSAEESLGIPEAEETLAAMEKEVDQPGSKLKREGIGFRYDGGDFMPNPVVVEHMGIAMERAENQFRGWPAMPEDEETSLRFPGVDPVGKYSVIDMKVAQRMAQVNAMLESRSPEVQAYAKSLMDAVKTNPAVEQIDFSLQETAKKHRILTRASKLCLNADGRKLLHEQSRILEADLAVEQYNKYLQGIEYAAGVKTGPVPREVTDFYRDILQMPLDLERIKQAETIDRTRRELSLEFENLDNKLRQHQFSNPHNWGKTAAQVSPGAINVGEVEGAVTPYARATADRLITLLFRNSEKAFGDEGISRADHIIIDGKTVREMMYENFIKDGGEDGNFGAYFSQNCDRLTNEYVAGGLMSGKRIEAFVPDKKGNIPDEPVQITKKGYEPTALAEVTLNAWERFWSKCGFYKEKTHAAAEYQRMADARERVKAKNLSTRLDATSGSNAHSKAAYFTRYVQQGGKMPVARIHGFSADREAAHSIAVCAMVSRGYPAADVLDPDKLQNEKQEIGIEVMRRLNAPDKKWIAETIYNGQVGLLRHIDATSQTVDLLNEEQLMRPENFHLFAAASTLFDTFQEKDHCKREYIELMESKFPGQGEAKFAEMEDYTSSMGSYFRMAQESLELSVGVASGVMPTIAQNLVRSVVGNQAVRDYFREQRAAAPDKPFSMLGTFFGANTAANAHTSVRDPKVEKMQDRLDNDPNLYKSFGQSLLHGSAKEYFTVTRDRENPIMFKLEIKEPTKETIKNMENARDLQKADQKNMQNAMGGRAR